MHVYYTIPNNQILLVNCAIFTLCSGGKQGRSLLVNPSSKLSSQKWRNRVLERLQKFLRALLYQKNALCQDNPGLPNIHKFDKTKANDVQPLGTNSQYHNGWFSLK